MLHRRGITSALVLAIPLVAIFGATRLRGTQQLVRRGDGFDLRRRTYQHVEVLADDVYEGRAAGSRGGHAASSISARAAEIRAE